MQPMQPEPKSLITGRMVAKIAAHGFAALCLMWSIGCKKEAVPASARNVAQVEVVTVASQTISDEPEFIGQAEASRPVEIRSQVTGLLKALLYQEGRDVKKGAPLYQIDPVPFQAAAAMAKAKIAEAEARFVQASQCRGPHRGA